MPRGIKNQEVTCPICGKLFKPERLNIKYCSVECSNIYKSTITYKCTCKECGNEFESNSLNTKYCDGCIAFWDWSVSLFGKLKNVL
jgi:hypothetical protein